MDLPARVGRTVRTRRLGALVIVGVGTLLAVAAVEAFLLQAVEGRLVLALVEISLLLALAYGVVYAGYWLYTADFASDQVWRVALWSVVGLVGTGAIGAWVLVNQYWQDQAISNPVVIAIATLAAGAAGGILVGINEVRARSKAEEATRQREDLYVVNELLRHHILNGTQVIAGTTTTLEDHVDAEGLDHLETIRTRSQRLSDLVSDMDTLTGSLSGKVRTEPMPLAETLFEEVERARRAYPDASIAVSVDVPDDTRVSGDKALGAVFEHLLRNAIQHNDGPSPTVEVRARRSGDTVVARVEDDGPGFPVESREALFERGSHGEAGLGLYLVEALVTRYGGTVTVGDADELGGAAVVVELPLAELQD